MTEITFKTDKESGTIHWAASEQLQELVGQKYNLGEMEATQIEKLKNLSVTAKILLSAVAGAVIQHLIDNGVEAELIFSSGSFVVKE